MKSRQIQLAAGLLLLLGGAGCVGPGLEPPERRAASGDGYAPRDGGSEPVVAPPGTQDGQGITDAAVVPTDGGASPEDDAGSENADAASDSSTTHDAAQ